MGREVSVINIIGNGKMGLEVNGPKVTEKGKTTRGVSVLKMTGNAVNTLTHVMVGFVSVYMCYVAYSRGYSIVTVHALLCTLGVSFQLPPTHIHLRLLSI